MRSNVKSQAFRLFLLIHKGWAVKPFTFWDPEIFSCLCYSTYLSWYYSFKMACLSSKSLSKTAIYWPTRLHVDICSQVSGSASLFLCFLSTLPLERPGQYPARDLGGFIPSSPGDHGNRPLLHHGKEEREPLKGLEGQKPKSEAKSSSSLYQCRMIYSLNCNCPWDEAVIIKLIIYPSQSLLKFCWW